MNATFKRLLFPLILGLALCLSALLVLSPGRAGVVSAAGSIRYVAPSPLGNDSNNDCLTPAAPCATIQRAVDQATPGDEIRVAGGTYQAVSSRLGLAGVVTQVVYISKSLTVLGGYTPPQWTTANPTANPTRLDAQEAGRVVNIEGPLASPPISVTLQGLQLENGDSTGQPSPAIIGGGGGLHGFRVAATLRNNTLVRNQGQRAGGGILLQSGAPVALIDNLIITNTVEATGNHALGGGVALALNSAQSIAATLEGNIIRGNIARETNSAFEAKGGGLYLLVNNSVILRDNLIQTNRVETGNSQNQGGGGGIYLDGGQITIINTALVNNRITGPGYGAGLFALSNNVRGLHLTISRNRGGDESGLNIRSGTAALTNTILVNQVAGIRTTAGTSLNLSHILWFSNDSNITGTGTVIRSNEFTGTPRFEADGYHLRRGSPAVNRGVSAGVLTDIDGESREITPPDLGADEIESLPLYLPVIFSPS